MFIGKIELSMRSQELLKHYLKLNPLTASGLMDEPLSLSLEELMAFLSEEEPVSASQDSPKKHLLARAQLQAELMNDLYTALNRCTVPDSESKKPASSWKSYIKYLMLACAGLLVAGAEGFDGITTILGILPFPSILIFIAGLGFSLLSMVVFYSCDLAQISNSFGVSRKDASQLLDVYMMQLNTIKDIRKIMNTYLWSGYSKEELIPVQKIIQILKRRVRILAEESETFNKALNHTGVESVKFFVSAMVGLLFFGSGFFAGQSVALFIGSLFVSALLPTFWPVLLFSTLVGLAALSLYWYVELASIKKLVSSWFGLDEDKIEQLTAHENIVKEEKKLEHIQNRISETLESTLKLLDLQKKLDGSNQQQQAPNSTLEMNTIISFKENPHTFYFPHAEEMDKEQAGNAADIFCSTKLVMNS